MCISQATATVRVTVVDANDNAPSFAQSFYNATVLENSRGGVFVVSVRLAANCLVIHSNIAIIIRTYVHAFFKSPISNHMHIYIHTYM